MLVAELYTTSSKVTAANANANANANVLPPYILRPARREHGNTARRGLWIVFDMINSTNLRPWRGSAPEAMVSQYQYHISVLQPQQANYPRQSKPCPCHIIHRGHPSPPTCSRMQSKDKRQISTLIFEVHLLLPFPHHRITGRQECRPPCRRLTSHT